MKIKNDMSTPCVVKNIPVDNTVHMGLSNNTDNEISECRIIDCVRKLTALGLSSQEIENLDISQPMLKTICEYAQLDFNGPDTPQGTSDTIRETLRIIDDQLQNLDIELEMLSLRKKALNRRNKSLKKLAHTLELGDEDLSDT